jgi:hypothetical protein
MDGKNTVKNEKDEESKQTSKHKRHWRANISNTHLSS